MKEPVPAKPDTGQSTRLLSIEAINSDATTLVKQRSQQDLGIRLRAAINDQSAAIHVGNHRKRLRLRALDESPKLLVGDFALFILLHHE
ncbi:hypothetical protein FEF26_15005 [Nesterenkonia salmonea]|uniref:Uncharacterized protein n=1 Tax=Nesterenkonia salmonea TaxID=1804987 RepID=A0A5R9B727_9MICC|nr:hypothetical protein [Nesterenkonia salmonea]TLP92227.1 hypothetical protein FEF26_15005 [Nesterenkonia salmonea]